MIERLKRALVRSFIGAIALGYVLAIVIIRFAEVFTQPFEQWATWRPVPGLTSRSFTVEDALRVSSMQLVAFLVLGLVWYLIFRWLYFKPTGDALPEHTSGSQVGGPDLDPTAGSTDPTPHAG